VTPFLLELPSYKMPRPRAVGRVLWERGGSFVKRAGTIILAVSVLVWAAGYFPRSAELDERYDAEIAAVEEKHPEKVRTFEPDEEQQAAMDELLKVADAEGEKVEEIDHAFGGDMDEVYKQLGWEIPEKTSGDKGLDDLNENIQFLRDYVAYKESLSDIENRRAGEHLENSILGRMGHVIEPAVEPLGWDWRIGMAAIASFPAREVIVATLGTIFNLGGDQDEESQTLREVVQNATRPDGSKLFSLATGLSIMVFFALCAQCAATLAVMRRETNSWKWPIASFLYMTTLAYVAALVTFQVASALGG
jgi:ferrous iron transport protein B